LAKRGLLISYYFPPTGGGGVQRWTKYIKYLSDYGWEFKVIANDPETSGPIDETLLNDIPEKTKIVRTHSSSGLDSLRNSNYVFKQSRYWKRWISAFFNITDSRATWNTVVKKYIEDDLKKHTYDVIIFTIPPYSLAKLAVEIQNQSDCPVILDMRDPWTINPYKIYPTKLHLFLDQHRELDAISNIRNIISAYGSTIDNYTKRIEDFSSKNILILPNGFDESDFVDLKSPESFKGGKYNIGFSGSIYSHLNTPDPIFKAMRKLKDENMDVHFHHVGTSAHNLSEKAIKYGIQDKIHSWGYVDHKKSLNLLNMMDALCLILDEKWPKSENTIGGKFYEYLRLKKPIFALVPEHGEASKVIQKTHSGVIVSAKKAEKIAEDLKSLLLNKQRLTWEDVDMFSREKQVKDLDQYFKKLNTD
jgi:glycosyltransferase involved in cell wall biosynthesis